MLKQIATVALHDEFRVPFKVMIKDGFERAVQWNWIWNTLVKYRCLYLYEFQSSIGPIETKHINIINRFSFQITSWNRLSYVWVSCSLASNDIASHTAIASSEFSRNYSPAKYFNNKQNILKMSYCNKNWNVNSNGMHSESKYASQVNSRMLDIGSICWNVMFSLS